MADSNRKLNPSKPSDYSAFVVAVYSNSATFMDFEQYLDYYEQPLQIMFFNPEIDLPLAIEQQAF